MKRNNYLKIMLLSTVCLMLISTSCKKNKPATLSTNEVINITSNTATSGGNISDDGNTVITERGVCWSASPVPTIENNKSSDGTGTGNFSSEITGLTPETTYYVRAYATNETGVAYGNEVSFTTEALPVITTVTDYEGHVYNTVVIGNQTWMAENLRSTKYSDGTDIPLVTDNATWQALGNNNNDKAYCFFNNDANGEAAIYGALYSWAAAMNGSNSSNANPSGVQGICPTGWHLPGDNEWKELEMFLGMTQAQANAYGYRGTDEGGKLKETGTNHWTSPNTGATNETGFTALPGGIRDGTTGLFHFLGIVSYMWSSTQDSGIYAWYRSLGNDTAQIFRYDNYKSYGFSVRCVKDQTK